ncbi:hypothetical protein RRG08_005303 [Elysia crispata]|uniref:Uncharacterized protein n=1 Tax=Elysia crispata TaxID=231223 RepID=A0AAE1D304_9GAST|nr:hypothetical protein RRG08_005303 [Elysia crispata]
MKGQTGILQLRRVIRFSVDLIPAQPGSNTVAGVLEGPSLGPICRVVDEEASEVGTQKQNQIGCQLGNTQYTDCLSLEYLGEGRDKT